VKCRLDVAENLGAKEGRLRIEEERTKDEERIHHCECEAESRQKLQGRAERVSDEKRKEKRNEFTEGLWMKPSGVSPRAFREGRRGLTHMFAEELRLRKARRKGFLNNP
jgi:hypothetical protein